MKKVGVTTLMFTFVLVSQVDVLYPFYLAFPVYKSEEAPEDPNKLPLTEVCFRNDQCIMAEIAATPSQRARGLMFRKELPNDHGMLFVFPKLDFWSFWMKNTLIPLDMIWLDENHRVVTLATHVPPCSTENCPTYSPMQKALFVLEIRAGNAEKWKIGTGDILKFDIPEKVQSLVQKQKP